MILDSFSRCFVGWLIALRESAEQLIAETVALEVWKRFMRPFQGQRLGYLGGSGAEISSL